MHIRNAFLILLAFLVATPLAAQRRSPKSPQKKDAESAVVEQLKKEFATLALEFWTTRLNRYKQQIDRTLSPADLAELNRARVFVGIFVEEKQWKELGEGTEEIFEGESNLDLPMPDEHRDGAVSERIQKSEEERAAETARIVDRVSEVAENFFLAKRLARRYRPQLGDVRARMTDDLRIFLDTVVAFKARFAAAHRAEIDRNSDLREGFDELDRAKMDGLIDELGSKKELGILSTLVIEPLILLYNGQDIMQIIRENDLMPEELGDLAAGVPSVLQGSRLNPTGASTTVSYILPEASRSTTLRLYNAAGELVGTYDQGPRAAGRNSVDIDLGKLPSGTYIYSLSVTDSRGERIYSRGLQVAK